MMIYFILLKMNYTQQKSKMMLKQKAGKKIQKILKMI